ncbi:hypothetical protein IQ07DRAFT_640637 [Pyrenochaeta sp. DS3sAY3a]|nr:hypothetical protein IQ07DRAFT_640637 [Pyrenochaeta sp. DS3sAY3a]
MKDLYVGGDTQSSRKQLALEQNRRASSQLALSSQRHQSVPSSSRQRLGHHTFNDRDTFARVSPSMYSTGSVEAQKQTSRHSAQRRLENPTRPFTSFNSPKLDAAPPNSKDPSHNPEAGRYAVIGTCTSETSRTPHPSARLTTQRDRKPTAPTRAFETTRSIAYMPPKTQERLGTHSRTLNLHHVGFSAQRVEPFTSIQPRASTLQIPRTAEQLPSMIKLMAKTSGRLSSECMRAYDGNTFAATTQGRLAVGPHRDAGRRNTVVGKEKPCRGLSDNDG